jgi:hypothetical protein
LFFKNRHISSALAELIRSTRAPTKDRLIGKIMGGNPAFRGTRVPVHMLAEFFAEIDLLVALSACPGGDCGASHSDDSAKCSPLNVEVHRPCDRAMAGWQSPLPNKYSRSHGVR